MASGRRDSSPGRLALAFPSIWKKVRYRWSPHRINSVDLGASTGSLSEALMYPWIVPHHCMPPDGRPRSLSCQLPGPPLQWQLLVDDDASSAKSPGNSPRNSFSSTGSVASQASSSKDNRSEHSQGSRAGLAKLARLLTPREKSVAGDRPSSHGSDNSLAPDVVSLRKANSIDSLLESSSSGFNLDIGASEAGSVSPVTPGSANKALPASPSVPAKLESQRKGNGPSTSPTVSSRHSKETRQGSLERIIDSGPLTKAERKKLEKVNKFNIDLQALFASVEHEQLERARSILQSTRVDVNRKSFRMMQSFTTPVSLNERLRSENLINVFKASAI